MEHLILLSQKKNLKKIYIVGKCNFVEIKDMKGYRLTQRHAHMSKEVSNKRLFILLIGVQERREIISINQLCTNLKLRQTH